MVAGAVGVHADAVIVELDVAVATAVVDVTAAGAGFAAVIRGPPLPILLALAVETDDDVDFFGVFVLEACPSPSINDLYSLLFSC